MPVVDGLLVLAAQAAAEAAWWPVLVGGLVAAAGIAIAVLVSRRPSESQRLEAEVAQMASMIGSALTDFGQVRTGVDYLGRTQSELRGQILDLHHRVEEVHRRVDATNSSLAEKTIQAQSAIQREVAQAQKLVEQVRLELAERKRRDEEVERSVRHLEAVLSGSSSKGAAGENILDEAFGSFPPEMVEHNFRVRGKVVEYALVLSGSGRRMPIDSKWPATTELERLAEEPDPAERRKLVSEVRTGLRRKVREVAQYLDPLTTTDKAIAAIPDAAYPHCGELAFEAYRQGVILMPYSMVVPYVLNLYNLHLRYSRSVDLDALADALSDIGRNVEALEKTLEDRLHRGATMVGNAYDDVKRIASQIKLTLEYVKALPGTGEPDQLPGVGEPGGACAEAAAGAENADRG